MEVVRPVVFTCLFVRSCGTVFSETLRKYSLCVSEVMINCWNWLKLVCAWRQAFSVYEVTTVSGVAS